MQSTAHYLHRIHQDDSDFILVDSKGEVLFIGEEYACKDYHHQFTGVSLVSGLPPEPNELPQDIFEQLKSHVQYTNEAVITLIDGETFSVPLNSLVGNAGEYWKQVKRGIYSRFNRHFQPSV